MTDRSSIVESYPGLYYTFRDQVSAVLRSGTSAPAFRIRAHPTVVSFSTALRNREPAYWRPTQENIRAHLDTVCSTLLEIGATLRDPSRPFQIKGGDGSDLTAIQAAEKVITGCSRPLSALNSYTQTLRIPGSGYELDVEIDPVPFFRTFTTEYDIKVGNPTVNRVSIPSSVTATEGEQIRITLPGNIQDKMLRAAGKDQSDLSDQDRSRLQSFATSLQQGFAPGQLTNTIEIADSAPISVTRTVALSRIPITLSIPLKAPPRAAFPQGFTPGAAR